MGNSRTLKNFRFITFLSAVLLFTGCGGGGGGSVSSEDTKYPSLISLGSGITFSNIKSTSITVTWGAASENGLSRKDLLYKVVYSTTNNLDTVSNAKRNGTSAADWLIEDRSKDFSYDPYTYSYSYPIVNLQSLTTYYIAVLVKDHSGHETLYAQQSVTTGEWKAVGTPGFSPGRTTNVSLDMYNGVPYVAYSEVENNDRASVMRFDNSSSTWVSVGPQCFSPDYAESLSLKVTNGTPYVAFKDYSRGGKATVMKYDSGSDSWVNVGPPGFSGSSISYLSFFLYGSTPYVAFKEYFGSTYMLTVMKYSSGSDTWIKLGSPGFLSGEPGETSLFVYNGTPYVAFQDLSNYYKVTVRKFNLGTSLWDTVGSSGLSPDSAYGLCLYIYDGIPYLSFEDGGMSRAMSVMRYDADLGDWSFVGPRAFSRPCATASSSSLYISDGIPYVAFNNTPENQAATLMRYSSSTRTWGVVGSSASSSIGPISLCVSSGLPFIAYRDNDMNDYKAIVMKCE